MLKRENVLLSLSLPLLRYNSIKALSIPHMHHIFSMLLSAVVDWFGSGNVNDFARTPEWIHTETIQNSFFCSSIQQVTQTQYIFLWFSRRFGVFIFNFFSLLLPILSSRFSFLLSISSFEQCLLFLCALHSPFAKLNGSN